MSHHHLFICTLLSIVVDGHVIYGIEKTYLWESPYIVGRKVSAATQMTIEGVLLTGVCNQKEKNICKIWFS